MSALISTETLFSRLVAPTLRVVDASIFPPQIARDSKSEYPAQHIPGAAFFDIDTIADTSTPLPHMLPSPEKFAEEMAKLGISNDTEVVAYDTMGIFGAARAWWMLRAMGHKNVKVLDGGLPKWLAEGRPVTSALPLITPSQYTPAPRPELVKAQNSLTPQLLDARSAGRFNGTEQEPWVGRRSGHVPGATNLPFTDLLNDDKTMRSPAELRQRFETVGINLLQPVTCMCGSGVSACVQALALYEVGHEAAAVYDGSWAEWGLPGGGLLESA